MSQALNRAIYIALKAAGLPAPSGFGEGQLTALTHSDDAVRGFLEQFFASFADGGIMTPSGPLPLDTVGAGGVRHAPRLSLFGEGRLPEAYVPLPDGRSIPVTVRADGAANDEMARELVAANRSMVGELRQMRAELARLREDNQRMTRALARVAPNWRAA